VEFDENPDHRAIREAVAKIAAPFGGQYYTTHAEEHTPTDELWHALGRLGFIGINLPEQFGGGGAGLAELALVCEETAAQGAQGGLRDHRARRRLEYAPALDHRRTRR
jgi:alkylation response protein AidB-like acyl-CoA dehydrogenase